jgi:hypothetical protein
MPSGPFGLFSCLGLALALSAVPQTGCLAQNGKRPVGLIVSIVPHKGKLPASNVLIKSQGIERPVSEGDFVSDGDEIIVPGRDQTVVISQRGGNSTICSAGEATDRCRSVVAGGSLLSPLGRFYESIIRISRRMTTTTSAASTLSSRDVLDAAPLSMTIDRSRPQKLQPGERSIWLCWSGGDGPFLVKTTAGTKVLAETTSTTREAILPAIRIADQSVVVTIHDARGQKLAVAIQGSQAMPAPPAFSEAAPSEEADQFIKAAWLSQQDGGHLKLEAAQRLTALAPKLHAADTLRRGLLSADT